MRRIKKLVAAMLSITLAVSGIQFTGKQEVMADSTGIISSDFLKANGKVLRNNYGSGSTVYLRGINAGGLTVQEFWMCPTSYSTNVSDQYDIWTVLTNRFGAQAARTLVNLYRDNYWTEADFDRCARLGMNCIRLPLWYRDFVDANNNWYSDAFTWVDWFVAEAGERGMYVILDMHGAYGSQNGSDHSGVDGGDNKLGASEFFFGDNAASNQEKFYQMWEKIAEHYRGNPIVAGYDLLNEPYCTYRYNSGYSDDYLHSMVWSVYDNAYKRIRAKDPDHVIIMEATWDSWDLPNPDSYGWSNVMYEYHQYEYSDYDNAEGKQISSMQNKINNIFNGNYNVPSFMGEFNYFNNMNAWDQGLQMLNNNGLNWTMWTYKVVSEYGNWGIMNQSIEWVNVDTDSYDEIYRKWSNVGNAYENSNLISVVSRYLPGTVKRVETTTLPQGAYYLTCDGKVVCAEDSGNAPLVANRDSFGGAWETLHIINNGDGSISFKSDVNGKYVCAVIDENSQLLARSDVISDWEKFYLVHIQGNQYGIMAGANGKFVKADFGIDNVGELRATADSVAGAWEAFDIISLSGETPTSQEPTTQTPTTQAPTTSQNQSSNGPDEVFGHLISATTPGIIDVVWGLDGKGQTYNVYVDGNIATDSTGTTLRNIGCAAYRIPAAAGTHTVKITAVLNGQESAGVSQSVTVTGSSEVVTTTQPSNNDGYTTAGANWTELANWSVYFASGWGGDPTGAYKDGGSLGNFAVKINTAGSGEWAVQLRSATCLADAGKKYKVTIKANSNMASSAQIRFKEENTQTEKFYTLVSGTNTFELEFTSTGSALFFFDLGLAPAGLDLQITDFSLVCTEAPTEAPTTTTQYVDPRPSTPEGLVCSVNEDENFYTIAFASVLDATSYSLYINGSYYGAITNGGTWSYYGLNIGDKYTIQVTAVNEHGESDLSAAVEVTIPEYKTVTISNAVTVKGFQISNNNWGVRTLSTYEPQINGLEVTEFGNIYGIIEDGVSEKDMVVDSNSQYIAKFVGTTEGILSSSLTDDDSSVTYVMTMVDNGTTAEAYTQEYMIRSYVVLSDGSVVYSPVYTYSIFDIADFVYSNGIANNYASHEYIYNNILSVVDSAYKKKEFDWSGTIVGV